jgi:hypothetical protein
MSEGDVHGNYICQTSTAQCLRNAVDYGHCIEFAITGDINLGFHKEFLYAISTKMGH